MGIAAWGRMYGNREFGGEPGSLLLYIIIPNVCIACCLRALYMFVHGR